MAYKLKVRGNYRRRLDDGLGTVLKDYETEIVVAAVRPDYIRDAVQAKLPSQVSSYESLQTSYPDNGTIEEVDEKLTADVYATGNPLYSQPKEEKREIGPNDSAAGMAARQGEEAIREQAASPEATGIPQPESGTEGETSSPSSLAPDDDQPPAPEPLPGDPSDVEPGRTYEEEVQGSYSSAETLTPSGTIRPGDEAPTADEDDTPPAPQA